MKTTTGFDFADAKIIKVLGIESYGTAQSRNIGSDIGAGLKSLVGGKIGGYTKLLNTTREEALKELCKQVENAGGNAIIGINFETAQVGADIIQILVYGTAVIIEE